MPRTRLSSFGLTLIAALFWVVGMDARAAETPLEETYGPYAVLLERFVVEYDLPGDGLVSAFDYSAALEHPETGALIALQRSALSAFDPEGLDSREAAVAFWLNAYNFFMVAHILENPRGGEPVSSVRDFGHLFNPYRVFRRKLFDVGGRKYSLSEIELQVLLGDEFRQRGWKDARVHFAVNCASVGCPPLRPRPYTAANVDELLAENTRRSLSTPLHLRVEGTTLYLSSLFDWYEQDFLEEADSIRQFIRDHAAPEVREQVRRSEHTRFIDYDWTLNSPENFRPWLE